jgi:Leucine-rich repeat (LRR) protein
MTHKLPRRRNFDNLKKDAKHWLAALREHNADARTRLAHVLPNAPEHPALRDVQLALARENGFAGWAELKRALTPDPTASANTLQLYEEKASALLEAYRTGTPEAMERHYRHTWHRRPWQGMRTYVQLDLGKRPDKTDDTVEITLDDARHLIAIEHGFENWSALMASVSTMPGGVPLTAKPLHVRVPNAPEGSLPIASTRDWQIALRHLAQIAASSHSAQLDANGQMTDTMLENIAGVASVTSLNLSGSQAVTDAGLRHLARLPNLRHLDLSGTAITDRGLIVLRDLPKLETISLAMTRITDEGVVPLASCDALEQVNLSWTRTGDNAVLALAGKRRLNHFRSGNNVTDAGLELLHELPVFKTWHGGEVKMSLLSYEASPNYLSLRGPFTDHGMRHLRGLDGLFALNLDDSGLALTSAGLAPLVSLPNLGWLAVDAKDDRMPYIAEMPHLRFLGAQDTTAGDDGFAALGRSRSIEYLWGRRCHNLRHRGFLALAEMPVLRGLSVSCLNVDDKAISALPRFPALKELMPMDIPDAGYRHIGKCEGLESLILMYCRDTTDAATEQITGLPKLSYYFNSYTTITDRTPELLSSINTLERITFDACHSLTDSGVAKLARLPRLKELRVSGKGLTAGIRKKFPASVTVYREP